MINNLFLTDNALQILDIGKRFGNMNTGKNFYPDTYTAEMRWSEFLKRRIKVGQAYGFDGHKMFMADQRDKTGSWFEITRDYVEVNPDGWSDIPEDILIVTDSLPGVVIGHPVADSPVVMAYDTKQRILAIGHCSAELVDKKMPMLVVDALLESYASHDEDILAYVSACAGKSWTYDCYPSWAKDDMIWNDVITIGEDGLYHIDLKRAVFKQLVERKVGGIMDSPIDTITNSNFYSNSAARSNPDKKGINFAGAFFK